MPDMNLNVSGYRKGLSYNQVLCPARSHKLFNPPLKGERIVAVPNPLCRGIICLYAAPSSRSSYFFSSIPRTAEKPPMPPSSLITRWQGMTIGKRVASKGSPDCAHGPGAADCLSKPAIGSHLTVGNGGCRLPDLFLKLGCRGKIKGAVKTGHFSIEIFLQFPNRFFEARFPRSPCREIVQPCGSSRPSRSGSGR